MWPGWETLLQLCCSPVGSEFPPGEKIRPGPCPRTVTTTAAAVILGGKVLGVNHCVPADQQVGSTTLICHVSLVVSLWHRVIIGLNGFWLISYLTLDHKLENKTAHRTAINCHTRPMIRIQIQLKLPIPILTNSYQ